MSIFSNLFTRSTDNTKEIVNPCPTPDDPGLLPAALQDYRNKQVVNPMNLSTFFAAVNIVSNSIAMMKWLFKDDENNKLNKKHYLYHLFDKSPITRFNIVKNIIQDIILYGNGFMFIERDRETGQPKTLHYSPAKQTTIWFDELQHKLYYYNYSYSTKIDDGTNYLHFYLNSDDGFIGRGILKYAYNVLDIASVVQNATKSYYSTTGQQFGIVSPNGVLPVTGNMQKQLNDLRAKWEEVRNKSNKGTIFFPSDLKFTPLTNTAKDSALIEAREYNAPEIGRFVANISPILLGDLRHNVYNQLSESQREFVVHSLAPYVTMIEEQCNKKLIMPSKQGKEFVDLDENSILCNDQEKQGNYISGLVKNGIMTINEARNIIGLAPVEGGDENIIPFTDINANKINQEGTEEENKENNKDKQEEEDEQTKT